MESWAAMLSLKDEMQTYCEFEESEDLQTYDECTAQYWETYDGFFGIIFTILVLGLLAATCAVSSSILCKLNRQLHAREASELVRSTLRPANGRGANCERLLSRYTSADNTCNCYQPPAAPTLLTIARLSNIAFVGHVCLTVVTYAPLGIGLFIILTLAEHNNLDAASLVVFVILCLISVSRVATTSTGRTVWPGPNVRGTHLDCCAHSIYACSACAFRLWCVGQPLSQGVWTRSN